MTSLMDNPREHEGGWVLSYFTTASEALHLAVSRDGRRFEPLGQAPVLRSRVGSRALRDPFLGRTPDGVLHLLATDGWRSDHIVHATSLDLLAWSEPELLPVMAAVPGALNAWAPEFFVASDGTAHLIWSSIVSDSADTGTGTWIDPAAPQRIWTASTRDFRTFSPARVFFDPGHTVIDATVARDGAGFLMAYKDERGRNELGTENKCIRFARFADPAGPFELGGRLPVSPVEGPALYRRGEEWIVLFDHFLEDRYGAMRSADAVAWSPVDVDVPEGMRHASVLRLDDLGPLLADPLDRRQTQPALRD
jgi:hypothetical protein